MSLFYQVHDGEINDDENEEQSINIDETEEVDDDYDYDDDDGVKTVKRKCFYVN